MSLKYEKALELARQHLSEEPLSHDDYRWKLPDGKQVRDGWYFDYTIECVHDWLPEQWDLFAGAPGFIVSDDGVRVVSWAEFHELSLGS